MHTPAAEVGSSVIAGTPEARLLTYARISVLQRPSDRPVMCMARRMLALRTKLSPAAVRRSPRKRAQSPSCGQANT